MKRRFFSSGWNRSKTESESPFPKRICHFCTLSSIIVPLQPTSNSIVNQDEQASSSSTHIAYSTGSIDNWFCSQCQCWNRLDENEEGGMKSWERGMAEERSNVGKRSVSLSNGNTTLHPSILPDDDLSIVDSKQIFCHSCQTNQTLVLSMISNYEQQQQETFDLSKYQKWKSDLEKRYPAVCSNCQRGVEDRLRRADQRARALIWNDLLRKQRQSNGRIVSSPIKANSSMKEHSIQYEEEEKEMNDVFFKTVPNNLSPKWYLCSFGFYLSWFIDFVILFVVGTYPATQLSFLIFSALLLFFVTRRWDPSLPQQIRLTASRSYGKRIKLQGLENWRKMLYFPLVIRATIAFQYAFDIRIGWMNKILFVLQVAFCYQSYRTIQIQIPTRISLKSRTLSEKLQPPSGQQTGPNFGNLSLQDGNQPIKSKDEEDLNEEETEEIEVGEDSMDWSPTLPNQMNPRGGGFEYTLGPQKFFEPMKDTGLEDMLRKSLGFRDEQIKEDEPMEIDTDPQQSIRENTIQVWPLFPILALLIIPISFLILQKMTNKDTLIELILSKLSQTIMLPIQNWWASALELSRQRSPYQGLWQTSLEKNADEI